MERLVLEVIKKIQAPQRRKQEKNRMKRIKQVSAEDPRK